MDAAVTWNQRRKGWMGPPRERPAPPPAKEEPMPPVVEETALIVPAFPSFSPAAIADLLKVYRSTVQYWMVNGKLESFTDNIGARYVLRAELIRFAREYLARVVSD